MAGRRLDRDAADQVALLWAQFDGWSQAAHELASAPVRVQVGESPTFRFGTRLMQGEATEDIAKGAKGIVQWLAHYIGLQRDNAAAQLRTFGFEPIWTPPA